MVLPISESSIMDYYQSGNIIEKMLAFANNREMASRTSTGTYMPRPNIAVYRNDIIGLIHDGAVSFHGSVERWSNPMYLTTGMTRRELDRQRIGWDFILDVDSDYLVYSKMAANLLFRSLEAHGIKSISVKFSGNTGFHIAVPFESFPATVNKIPIASQFPEIPRMLVTYLRTFIQDKLRDDILARDSDIETFALKLGKKPEEVLNNGMLNPFAAVNIDAGLICSRHMIRMPYSLHEKTWLVSLPIDPTTIYSFNAEQAKPSEVASKKDLLDFCPASIIPNEAAELLEMSLKEYFYKAPVPQQQYVEITTGQIFAESAFPPCIQHLLSGVEDGRKRAEFILRTFLRRSGWDWSNIEARLLAWNKLNKGPLEESYIKSQIAWQKGQDRRMMPPNCSDHRYADLGICHADEFCKDVKNPVIGVHKRARPTSSATTKDTPEAAADTAHAA